MGAPCAAQSLRGAQGREAGLQPARSQPAARSRNSLPRRAGGAFGAHSLRAGEGGLVSTAPMFLPKNYFGSRVRLTVS